MASLNETPFEIEIPAVLIVGSAPPAVLSQWTGVPRSSCFQKPLRMERLLDQVGLTMALIDLRSSGDGRLNRRRAGRPDEEAEACFL